MAEFVDDALVANNLWLDPSKRLDHRPTIGRGDLTFKTPGQYLAAVRSEVQRFQIEGLVEEALHVRHLGEIHGVREWQAVQPSREGAQRRRRALAVRGWWARWEALALPLSAPGYPGWRSCDPPASGSRRQGSLRTVQRARTGRFGHAVCGRLQVPLGRKGCELGVDLLHTLAVEEQQRRVDASKQLVVRL